MANYPEIYDMQSDATLVKKVTVACQKAATDVLNELVTVPNHVARVAWAKSILGGTAPALVDRMVTVCTHNPTLQLAPVGPWPDADVQFVVNANLDAQATAGA